MAEVAQQTVADVDGAVRHAAQRLAQSDARGGRFEALARGGQYVRCQRDAPLQRFKRQARIAQRAADVDVVTHARAAAQQGLARRHFAQHGDAEVERPLCGVAAHQLAAVGVGQRQQTARKWVKPCGIDVRQCQRQRASQRARAARGQVAQVDSQRFVAEALGVGAGKKVAALDQHIARYRQLHPRRRCQQRAVIAHAQHGMAHRALEIAGNQVKFTHIRACQCAALEAGQRLGARLNHVEDGEKTADVKHFADMRLHAAQHQLAAVLL